MRIEVFKALKSLLKKKHTPESLIHAYGGLLATGKLGPRSVLELPASKDEIGDALVIAIRATPSAEHLRTGYMLLADFQDFEECAKNNWDVTELMMIEMKVRLNELDELQG